MCSSVVTGRDGPESLLASRVPLRRQSRPGQTRSDPEPPSTQPPTPPPPPLLSAALWSSHPAQWSWSWSPRRWCWCSSLCTCHPEVKHRQVGHGACGWLPADRWGGRYVTQHLPRTAAAGKTFRLQSHRSGAAWTSSHCGDTKQKLPEVKRDFWVQKRFRSEQKMEKLNDKSVTLKQKAKTQHKSKSCQSRHLFI